MATRKPKGNTVLFDNALKAEGITGPVADLARSIYFQESGGGRNTTTSNAGAVGGMQIIPSTFKSVADNGWDINDPMANARAGIRYVNKMVKAGGGDLRLAAVGYYGGPGAINKAKRGEAVYDRRNSNAPNTFQYADQVLARMGGAPAGNVPVRGVSPTHPANTQLSMQLAGDEEATSRTPFSDIIKEMAQPKQTSAVTAEEDPWQTFLKQMDATAKEEQAKKLASQGGVTPDALDFMGAMSQPFNVASAPNKPMMNSFQDWMS